MFLLAAIFQLITFHSANASPTEETIKKALKSVHSTINSAGTINYKNACANCATITHTMPISTLYSKSNSQNIDLSVLSMDEATEAFNELAARSDIPFGYPMDGCYARAHKMARLLEDKGIISGKAFVEGSLYVDTKFGEIGWGYHVAPVVMVKKGNANIPYIFDPSLFSKPVPYTEWKAKMTAKSKASVSREYFTNRFAYDPSDRTQKYTSYQEEPLEDMDRTNKEFSNALKQLN